MASVAAETPKPPEQSRLAHFDGTLRQIERAGGRLIELPGPVSEAGKPNLCDEGWKSIALGDMILLTYNKILMAVEITWPLILLRQIHLYKLAIFQILKIKKMIDDNKLNPIRRSRSKRELTIDRNDMIEG
jgi:hypothetical protein